MQQCKVPLAWYQPHLHVCVLVEGHEGLHRTYGLKWNYIYYGQEDTEVEVRPHRDMMYPDHWTKG